MGNFDWLWQRRYPGMGQGIPSITLLTQMLYQNLEIIATKKEIIFLGVVYIIFSKFIFVILLKILDEHSRLNLFKAVVRP